VAARQPYPQSLCHLSTLDQPKPTASTGWISPARRRRALALPCRNVCTSLGRDRLGLAAFPSRRHALASTCAATWRLGAGLSGAVSGQTRRGSGFGRAATGHGRSPRPRRRRHRVKACSVAGGRRQLLLDEPGPLCEGRRRRSLGTAQAVRGLRHFSPLSGLSVGVSASPGEVSVLTGRDFCGESACKSHIFYHSMGL
jgi:hypothetical protein